MANKKTSSGLVYVLVIAAVIFFLVRHFHIKNFNVIEQDVLYTSGQPRGMDYTRLLYKYHIGTIVNVRAPSEHRDQNWYNEEMAWVRGNGVNYVQLVTGGTSPPGYLPDEVAQQRFLEVMSDQSCLPVLLHGGSGEKKVAFLVAVWLRRARGYSVEDAIVVVERINKSRITADEQQFINGLVR